MANQSTNQLEQLRRAVLGNRRGREVEVEPTGEIRVPGNGDDDSSGSPTLKPSKMSKHTFAS